MTERSKGETQELHEAIGRVVRLRFATTGSPDRPSQQMSVTIPKAIASLMYARTELWRWDVTDEGVLLRPIDDADFVSKLPSWVANGASA